jgi:oligopeptide/dipeptide ABC transporter ATP-binding protein
MIILEVAKLFLEVKGLIKHFSIEKGFLARIRPSKQVVHAVCGVSFEINEGEIFGLVGETGSGKSTLGRCILRLLEPTSGSIIYKGIDITKINNKKMRELRREMQIIFQDPYSSLNPYETVEKIVSRPLEIHTDYSKDKIREKVVEMLHAVGLGEELMNRYPHELSGGQRQRVAIARALSVNPKFVVADEPTSALDVSIQAQILNLIQDLQEKIRFTCLLITHDLSVVHYLSNRVGVMYLGKLVELARTEKLFQDPLHPYTHILLSSIPEPYPEKKFDTMPLKGDIPSPINPPSGCRFHTRCRYSMEICKKIEPKLINADRGHFVACHLINREK